MMKNFTTITRYYPDSRWMITTLILALAGLFLPDSLLANENPLASEGEERLLATYTTAQDGAWESGSTWAGGVAPPTDVDGHTIIINHNIEVLNHNIKLYNGASLTATGVEFYMRPSYNFTIEDASATFTGCDFLQYNNFPNNSPGGNDGDGNLEVTKESGSLVMIGCQVWVAQNMPNIGYRKLEDVCLKVDENYYNEGTDILINVCAEIGVEECYFGSGSGNFQNSNGGNMSITASEFHLCNGNYQNSSASTLSGTITALWVQNGNLQNDGTWTAVVDHYLVEQAVQGNFNGGLPASESSESFIATFFNPCICAPGTNPDIALSKNFISAVEQANGSYDVTYTIVVNNSGTGAGDYDLTDVPSFDDDVSINSASYSSTTGANGNLLGNGPWTLANNQTIGAGNSQTYTLVVNVSLNLSDGQGDDTYDPCGNNPQQGDGLFNEAQLDFDDDGNPDLTDTDCGDLPSIDLVKDFIDAVQQANGTYNVTYEVNVINNGGTSVEYDLSDTPFFDDDVNINSAFYTSTVGLNGPLAGNGPWSLADDQTIAANNTDTYTLTVNVTLDLTDGQGSDSYTLCGANGGAPQAGEGLFNQADLDLDDDGTPELSDDACGDLPAIVLDKAFVSAVDQGNGTFDVTYTITVDNNGGATGEYDLSDTPFFDDDVSINSASYTSTVGLSGNLAGNGPWSLADDQSIAAGGSDVYTLVVNVSLDLMDGQGNDMYDPCDSNDPQPGEGLFNQADLDLNDDGTPDISDDDCGDLPSIALVKDFIDAVQQANGTYNVTYEVNVINNGGTSVEYDLSDTPFFDDDVSINSASYTSTAAGIAGGPLAGNGPWSLADDQTIAANSTDTYTLTVNVTLDLTDGQGSDSYTLCGANGGAPQAGEGLFNQADLDLDDDGTPELSDDACGDLPAIELDKSFVSAVDQGNGTFDVTYTITVDNNGGATGEYDLSDTPFFDDDVSINSASYTSTASGIAGGALAGNGPWSLADDQTITAGGSDVYTLVVNVSLDLMDGQGNDMYDPCDSNDPQPGEGLFNQADLDLNDDGTPDLSDDDCGDLPSIELVKDFIEAVQQANGTYNVTYEVNVINNGGTSVEYDLSDTPFFDDDVSINSAFYTSTAAGIAGGPLAGNGPWSLADDQTIAANSTDTYTLTVNVTLDLTDGQGSDSYTLCGANGGAPQAGEGLFNQADLDLDDDGTPELSDDACGDLPAIELDKSFVSAVDQGNGTFDVTYTITVDNNGGATGEYDLSDTPFFDDDVSINSASYTSTAAGIAGGALAGNGPWSLADDQTIAAGGSDVYTLVVNVSLDLMDGQGNDMYDPCDSNDPQPGEGLFNQADLDLNDDGTPDISDDDCGDLPSIDLVKDFIDAVQQANGTYNVTYEVNVINNGGTSVEYDLSDTPFFDDDVSINSAFYTSTAAGIAGGPLTGDGPWSLADDQTIAANSTDTYTLTVNVTLDLTDGQGSDSYTLCGANGGAPQAGEGLFNQADLDLDDDGTPELSDDACGDLPAIELDKSFVSAVDQGNGTFDVTYTITVDNNGGATGEYDLSDTPFFDDDVSINSASYTSTASGIAGGALAGNGPWSLADDQSIAAGGSDVYTLVVNVSLDLMDGQGNDMYDPCDSNDPQPGEGLFNQADLDLNDDGTPDLSDDDCGDLPSVDLDKSLVGVVDQGNGTYNVTYTVTVINNGGTPVEYDLSDTPFFDDDVSINSAFYSSTVGLGGVLTGSGPWSLADDQTIAQNGSDVYTLTVNVSVNLMDGQGSDTYTACGENGGAPQAGEGLFNRADLDLDDDGTPELSDDACGDVPFIPVASIDIEKATNGEDADEYPGVVFLFNPSSPDAITWTYVVTNTGNVTLTNIQVTDDKEGFVGTIPSLAPGASATLTLNGVAELGMYTNNSTATGQPVDNTGTPFGPPVSDTDPSNYTAIFINIEKIASSTEVCAGDDVTYTLITRMLGGGPGFEIRDISVVDNNLPGETLTSNHPFFIDASDIGDNDIIEFIDNNNDGISDEEFNWVYTLMLNSTNTNIANDMGTVFFVDQNGNETEFGMIGNQFQVTVDVVSPGLSLSVTPPSQQVDFGGDANFTVTVTNTGATPLENVVITDSEGNANCEITIANLAVGETQTFNCSLSNVTSSVTLDFDATADGLGTNGVVVCDVNAQATASILLNNVIDLELVKSVTPTVTIAGGTVTFTLDIVNQGPNDATGVLVEDILPDGYNFVLASSDYNPATGIWDVGSLAVGASETIFIIATVNENGNLFNVAEVVEADQDDIDSTPDNDDGDQSEDDEDNAEVIINKIIDLELDKSVFPTTVDVGDPVTFTIDVINQGPSTATGVTVQDFIQSGFTYTGTNGNYDPVTGIWDIGTLAVGQSVSLEIYATINLTGDYTNDAEIFTANEDDIDSTPGNGIGNGEDDEDGVVLNINCDLVVVVGDIECNDEGTASDPSDDTYTFSLTVTGTGVTDGWFTNIAGVTYTGDYGETVDFGPYNIENVGDLGFEVIDNNKPGCRQFVYVSAPETCSDDCMITAGFDNVYCNNSGTPQDPTDDVFFFDLFIVNSYNAGSGWTASVNGMVIVPFAGYISQVQGTNIGPFPIAGNATYPVVNGVMTVLVSDFNDPNCFTTINIPVPPTCSDQCGILFTDVMTDCDPNGTPSDPSDDQFSITVTVSGNNVGDNGWIASTGQTGSYGSTVTIGNFDIADGAVTLTFTDIDDPSCNSTITVDAPFPCSYDCLLTAQPFNIVCDDNNTPANAADDTYTFQVIITGVNTGNNGWEDNFGNTGQYGIVQNYGPFSIQNQPAIVLNYEDVDDPTCNTGITVNAPASCSPVCNIVANVTTTPYCDDNDTPQNPADDVYYFDVTVTGNSNASNSWNASGNTQQGPATGNYGVAVTYGPYQPGANVLITFTDAADGGCVDYVAVAIPDQPCSNQCLLTATATPSDLCDDMGTPFDPSDDEWYFIVELDGNNTSGAWVDNMGNAGSTIPELILYGPYPHGTESVTVTISDAQDPDCNATVTAYSPGPCSDGCEIDVDVVDIICLDNGTPSIAGDDQYEAVINVSPTGTFSNLGWRWKVLPNGPYSDPQPYGQDIIIGTFDIADGNVDIRITDAGNTGCVQDIELEAPEPCSGSCNIQAIYLNQECSDNGTADPTDDTYSFELLVINPGAPNTPWGAITQNGLILSGLPGVPLLVEDIPAGQSTVILNIAEVGNPDCNVPQLVVPSTGPCSDECIIIVNTLDPICDDNGTLGDPTDDTFTFIATVSSTEGTYALAYEPGNPIPQIVPFGQAIIYGPYPISGGDVTITWQNGADENCQTTRTISAPETCSDDSGIIVDCPINNHYCPILQENIMLFSTDPFDCTATIEAPLPEVSGTCTDNWTVVTQVIGYEVVNGQLQEVLIATILPGEPRIITGLELGDYKFRYIVTDDCGNTATKDCIFRVADITEPVAVCDDGKTVSIGGAGIARFYWHQIDDGSYDNCGIDSILVRRMYEIDASDCMPLSTPFYSDWNTFIDFNCCDVNSFVTVELRVVDLSGNVNTCSMEVFIEDNTEPYCYGVEDINAACSDLPSDFDPYNLDQLNDLFGEAYVYDNCSAETVSFDPVVEYIDCGILSITRQFVAIDLAGNISDDTLTQVISLTGDGSFNMQLPADAEVSCAEASMSMVEIYNGGCDSITVTYTDALIDDGSGTGCQQVQRTYSIINHCSYDGTSAPVIISRDEDCDGVEGEEEVWVLIGSGVSYVDADDDPANGFPALATKGVQCDGSTNPSGYWRNIMFDGYIQYTQILTINDQEAPVIAFEPIDPICVTESDTSDCLGLVEYPVTVTDDCMLNLGDDQLDFSILLDVDADGTIDGDVTNEVDILGSYPDYTISAEFPMGSHILRLTVFDACGNGAVANLPFEVIDCSAKSPDLHQGLVTELLPIPPGIDADGDGDVDKAAVQILATYLLQSQTQEDCTGPVSFSINRVGEEPNINKQSLIFTCDDISHNQVEVWAWDKANNPYAVQPDGSIGGENSASSTALITIMNTDEVCNSGLQSPGVKSVHESSELPTLFQNEPNPFAEQTTIRFWLPETEEIELSVYDLTGKEVKVLKGMYDAGYHEVQLNQEDLSSYGMFFYTLRTASFVDTKQMINLKY